VVGGDGVDPEGSVHQTLVRSMLEDAPQMPTGPRKNIFLKNLRCFRSYHVDEDACTKNWGPSRWSDHGLPRRPQSQDFIHSPAPCLN
jgi:hypothetical protein